VSTARSSSASFASSIGARRELDHDASVDEGRAVFDELRVAAQHVVERDRVHEAPAREVDERIFAALDRVEVRVRRAARARRLAEAHAVRELVADHGLGVRVERGQVGRRRGLARRHGASGGVDGLEEHEVFADVDRAVLTRRRREQRLGRCPHVEQHAAPRRGHARAEPRRRSLRRHEHDARPHVEAPRLGLGEQRGQERRVRVELIGRRALERRDARFERQARGQALERERRARALEDHRERGGRVLGPRGRHRHAARRWRQAEAPPDRRLERDPAAEDERELIPVPDVDAARARRAARLEHRVARVEVAVLAVGGDRGDVRLGARARQRRVGDRRVPRIEHGPLVDGRHARQRGDVGALGIDAREPRGVERHVRLRVREQPTQRRGLLGQELPA
jgi:hypothetical protein